MTGHLRSNYGFETGVGNRALIAIYFEDDRYGGDLLSSYRTDSIDEGVIIHKTQGCISMS